ncbi:MAG: FAD-binding protein [Gemmatimonadaceae bacterium]
MSEQSVAPDVALIVDQIHEARARGTPLRVIGAGTWLDAGRRCDTSHRLDVGQLTGITRYEPGDLTLTARAGTSLAGIARATNAEGQWLTLDAHGSPEGTLGATVATASAGPLASAYGTPRDHVLGCEFVSGTGDVVRAGGRVVKNVAGFDLTRLVTGAWGTLGALTEITVRLRARPEVDSTVAVDVDGAATAWSWLRQSDCTPLAAELLSPALASRLSLPGSCLLVRLGGNAAFVRAAGDAAGALGITTSLNADTWRALSAIEPTGAITLRVSTVPSRIGELWPRAVAFAERASGYAHATVSRGVVRCVLPASEDVDDIDHIRTGIAGLTADYTVVGERVPASLWTHLSHKRSASLLAEGVRRAFDPDGIMNPGILDVA